MPWAIPSNAPSSPHGTTETAQLLSSLVLEPPLKKASASAAELFPRSRLSPFLPQRSGGLLGRPRGVSLFRDRIADQDATTPTTTSASLVRRSLVQIPSNNAEDTTLSSASQFSTNGEMLSQMSVVPPPSTLAPITVADPGGPTSPSSSCPSELAGLSSLTITSDSETTRSQATPAPTPLLHSASLGASAGGTSALPISPLHQQQQQASSLPSQTTTGAHTGGYSPKDWRSAFRVPMLSQDGHVVGYRQNSLMLRRQMEVSLPSDLEGGTTPPESPLFYNNSTTPRFSDPTDEFAAAASDPNGGFRDAPNRVPGYLLGPIVGCGGFSVVRKALHVATGLPVAVKVIDKCRLADAKDRDRVDREIRVMRQLGGHVGIARLLEYAETPQFLYLIMEYCDGGSLLDHVRNCRKISEPEALMLFQQLLAALDHCHRRGVVHRDIKLENILLDGRGGLRLIDFGLCGYFMPDKHLRCHCGSPSYAAPEIVARREYIATPVDIWSAGIVLYAMLAGYLPFHAKDKRVLSRKIIVGAWKPPGWISDDALDLLQRMLTQDPSQRITLEGILKHPWVVNGPRWEGRGEGPGGLLRSPVDTSTGGQLPDPEVVAVWAQTMGGAGGNVDVAALMKGLRQKECNSLTAAYYLLLEAKIAAREIAENVNNRAGSANGNAGSSLSGSPMKTGSSTCASDSTTATSSTSNGGSSSARSSDTADLEMFAAV